MFSGHKAIGNQLGEIMGGVGLVLKEITLGEGLDYESVCALWDAG